MNSLEWIDKQILLVKENIQYHKDLLAESEEEYTDEIISAIKLLEPELQTLQQIKAELEAWYVVKPYVNIVDRYAPYPTWQLKPNYDECKLKDTNTLIKAKEIKDKGEKNNESRN